MNKDCHDLDQTHDFQPRFDERRHWKAVGDEKRERITDHTYLGDICVKCGHFVERVVILPSRDSVT